jgi:pentatricopeptide repeat protein
MGRRQNSLFLRVFLVALCAGFAFGCDQIKARSRIQQGNELHAEDEYEKAIVKYDEALELAPELAIGWFNLAIAHADAYKAGDKSAANEAHATAAINALSRYLTMQPKDVVARNTLLGMYTKSGRWDGALDYFKGEYQKNPRSTYVLAQLADISKQAKKWDDSRDWYAKLAEAEPLAPGKSNALRQLALTYGAQTKSEGFPVDDRIKYVDLGIATLLQAVEINPNDSDNFTYINLLYRQRSAGQKSYIVIIDTVTANQWENKALALIKAAAKSTPPATKPGAPAAPPSTPPSSPEGP